MIKPITTNPIIRKAVIGTMMAGAAMGTAIASKTPKPSSEPQQQVVVSKTAASGLAAMASPQSSATSISPSLRKFYEKQAKDYNNTTTYAADKHIEELEEKYGPYAATVFTRWEADSMAVNPFLRDYRSKLMAQTMEKHENKKTAIFDDENINPLEALLIGLDPSNDNSSNEALVEDLKQLKDDYDRFLDVEDIWQNRKMKIFMEKAGLENGKTRKLSAEETEEALDECMEELDVVPFSNMTQIYQYCKTEDGRSVYEPEKYLATPGLSTKKRIEYKAYLMDQCLYTRGVFGMLFNMKHPNLDEDLKTHIRRLDPSKQ